MYYHLCINGKILDHYFHKSILASNLPEKYESMAESCNVELETFFYEPYDITIHHGKISQGEVEIYLLSDNSDISNEVFKIYQNVYISILPNLISCWKNNPLIWHFLHDISHLVANISMTSYYREVSYQQIPKQIEEYQKVLYNIQNSASRMRTLINNFKKLIMDD